MQAALIITSRGNLTKDLQRSGKEETQETGYWNLRENRAEKTVNTAEYYTGDRK